MPPDQDNLVNQDFTELAKDMCQLVQNHFQKIDDCYSIDNTLTLEDARRLMGYFYYSDLEDYIDTIPEVLAIFQRNPNQTQGNYNKKLGIELLFVKAAVTQYVKEYVKFHQRNDVVDIIEEFENRAPDESKIYDELRDELTKVHASGIITPYVYVCGSSGVGKTTLAFKLHAPKMYFLFSHDTDPPVSEKSIYDLFSDFSNEWQKSVKMDYKKLMLTFAARGIRKKHRMDHLTHFNFNNSRISYETLGFIVGLLTAIFEKIKQKEDPVLRDWLKLQTTVTYIRRIPIRIFIKRILSEYYQLENVPNNKRLPLVIFLDECSVLFSRRSGYRCQFMFMMVGTILRLARIVPVFMGTDSSVTNFIGKRRGYVSRVDNLGQNIWGIIVHKFPPAAEHYINEVRDSAFKTMADIESINQAKICRYNLNPEPTQPSTFPTNAFIDLIFNLLRSERPYFTALTKRFFETFTPSLVSKFRSDYDVFCSLAFYVNSQFRKFTRTDSALFNEVRHS